MAKRGRPRKTVAKTEEPKNVVDEVVVEEQPVEASSSVTEEPIIQPADDVYDLNTPTKAPLGDSYNPFGESVEEKAYRTPKVVTAESIADISEPSFVAPTYEEVVVANETDAREEGHEEKNGLDRLSQDEIQEMPDKDKDEAADGLVDISLTLYSMGCKGLGSLAKISDKKLEGLQDDGLLDLGMRVPIDQYSTASVKQIVDSMNGQVADAFEVKQDFKDSIKPIMKRVFVKRGWGMTDEQTLLMMFGMDVAEKVGIVFEMRKAADYQLSRFMEMHEIQNGSQEVEFTSPIVAPRKRREEDTEPPTTESTKDDSEAKPKRDKIKKEPKNKSAEQSMVKSQNPDLKVNLEDLAQVDVDNV